MKRKSNFIKFLKRFIVFFVIIVFPQVILAVKNNDTLTIADRVSIGAKAGLNLPWMDYSSSLYRDYKSALTLGHVIGFYAEVKVSNKISLRPELTLIGKGQKLDDYGFDYKIKINYIDWRLPLKINFNPDLSFQPYILAGPTVGFTSGGYVQYDGFKIGLTTANSASFDLGIIAGIGFTHPFAIKETKMLFHAEVLYNHGLSDTYSEGEKEGWVESLNMSNYLINGSRKNRGIEISLSLAYPIENLKKPKNEPAKSLFAQEKEPIQEKEVEKECYTIEEINALIDMGKNVNNKVICMNNLNFDFNKSTLDKSSRGYLDHVVTLLNKVSKMNMKISGHTDNVGKDDFNLDLSKKRASAVYDYLVSKGVDKNRLSFEFFGASKPLVPNDSDENRAKNRRVEFEIIQK